MKTYVYRCRKCGLIESPENGLTVCKCGRPLVKVYASSTNYHPTKGA